MALAPHGSGEPVAHWPADPAHSVAETTVGDLLRSAAEDSSDRIALIEASTNRKWTFAELLEEAERAAGSLSTLLEPGDRLAICAPNSTRWLFTQLGAALAGIVVVPVNPTLPMAQIVEMVSRTRAAGVCAGGTASGVLSTFDSAAGAELPVLRQVWSLDTWQHTGKNGELPKVDPVDPCRVQFTLGTTGPPKPVILSHRGWTNNAKSVADALGAVPGERWVNPLPFFHVSGFGPTTLAALAARSTQVMVTEYDDASILAATAGAGIVSLPPPMVQSIVHSPALTPETVAALRVVSSGGMAYEAGLANLVEERLGARFTMAFGQTESTGITHKIRSDEQRPEEAAGTVGSPFPQIEAKVVADDGTTAPLNVPGEVCVRGCQVMTGYFDDPEATARKIDSDGWLHMGDIGTMDAAGRFRILARREEVIVVDGEYVFPSRIEAVLHEVPGVAKAAVIGTPDREIVAFVQGRGADQAPLTAHCQDRLPTHHLPSRWVFVEDLPLTPLGKVKKFQLADELAGRSGQSADEPAGRQGG